MKTAISSTGPDLKSSVDPRFGRCAYIIYYDTDTDSWEAVPNENRDTAGGAGIRTAQSVVDRGTEVVVTGNIGPNAMQVLATQVEAYTGFAGSVEEAVLALRQGGLSSTSSPTVGERAGQAGGPGTQLNPGGAFGTPTNPGGFTGPGTSCGGRGRGTGGGRGMGRWS